MAWKKFGIGEKMGEVFKTLKTIQGVGKSSSSLLRSTNQDLPYAGIVNSGNYERVHEIETQKAYVTSLSRHDRWKAGGPL